MFMTLHRLLEMIRVERVGERLPPRASSAALACSVRHQCDPAEAAASAA